MERALIAAILVIGATFVGLTLLIVANKAWRETRERQMRRRREVLEPLVLAHAHEAQGTLKKALAEKLHESDLEVVERILLDHVQRIRGVEHERLARALEELGFVDRQLRTLKSRRWWKRADASEKLGLSGARRAVPDLSKTLRDPVPEVRMRAAKALGLLGGTASIRELIRALDEPSRWSSIRIGDILTDLGREMVDELVAAFDKLSAGGKLAALDILARVRPLEIRPWLAERLSDPSPDVRARACHALGAIGDPDATSDLVGALSDSAWPVRAMAAKGLGKLRSADSVPPLCEMLRDEQWWVRSNAATALRDLGDKGLEALEWMLLDHDPYARQQAIQMLEQAGVVDEQAEALAATGASEREAARTFLKKLIAAGPTGRLRSLRREHPNQEVRRTLVSLMPTPQADEAQI